MCNNLFIASTLANDPHTEGMHQAAKIAKLAGIECVLLQPSIDLKDLCKAIKKYHPRYIGMSYRLTPEIGCIELEKAINYMYFEGVIRDTDDVKICFSGLPKTIEMLKNKIAHFPLKVELCEQYSDALDRAKETIAFFDIRDREKFLDTLKEEIVPKGIELLDELADEIVCNDNYKNEPPLRIPSDKALVDYTLRIQESPIPVLRTHFGIPDKTIIPTIEGIKEIADARVIDEVSLGSSDLSQRYFGHPEMFDGKKNDGGVPYKTPQDLHDLFLATRRGNFPSLKPYCHVTDLVNFIHTCLETGALQGAHQAVPLFWFNEMDGRGPMTVRESIFEHFQAVKELAKYGIPVEMNDPNQWSSRWAHDTIITTSYALISAVMTVCGVKDKVFQMQMNKPKETGDYADLAKMQAGMYFAKLFSISGQKIYRECRTGIESLSPDMKKAKWQLGRSTLLQMCLDPHIIHIVSYCEANYAARPVDIIDSSRLIRRAIKVFRQHELDIKKELENPLISERRDYLIKETEYLLDQIARINPCYQSGPTSSLLPYVADADVLSTAIENRIICAPGVINPKYKGDFVTRPMKYGMINLVNNYDNPTVISERQRLFNTKLL